MTRTKLQTIWSIHNVFAVKPPFYGKLLANAQKASKIRLRAISDKSKGTSWKRMTFWISTSPAKKCSSCWWEKERTRTSCRRRKRFVARTLSWRLHAPFCRKWNPCWYLLGVSEVRKLSQKAIVKSCTLTPITCTATQRPDLVEGLKRHKKLPTEDHFLNNDHNILGDPGAVCWVGKNGCENFKEQEKDPLGCYS